MNETNPVTTLKGDQREISLQELANMRGMTMAIETVITVKTMAGIKDSR